MKRRMIVLGTFAAMSLSGAVFGDFLIFTDPEAFFQALEKKGKVSKGFWDFKPNNLPPGGVDLFDDPLNFKTAPGTGIWDEMPLDNIQFQSNLDFQGGNGPNPRGVLGLLFGNAPPGFDNNTLASFFLEDSFDILSGVPVGDNHTAMALEVISLNHIPGAPIAVTVWDKNEQHKTKFEILDYQDGQKFFIGILAQDERTIGRVNIWDFFGGQEGISSIEVFVPAPGALALLGLAGLFVRRKRKRAA